MTHLGEIFETRWENEDVGRDVQPEKLVMADVKVDVGRHIRRWRNDGIHPVGIMSDPPGLRFLGLTISGPTHAGTARPWHPSAQPSTPARRPPPRRA